MKRGAGGPQARDVSSSCLNRQAQEMVLDGLENIGGAFCRLFIGDAIPQKVAVARNELEENTVMAAEKKHSMIFVFAKCAALSRL